MDYNTFIKPFSNNFKLITLDGNELEKVRVFVSSVIKAKSGENHYRIDNNSKFKRFFNGMIGEVAIEKLMTTISLTFLLLVSK